MKTILSMSTIRLAALLIVINGLVLAQDRREFGTTWKLTDTQEESRTIATDNYEIVIRLGTDKSIDAILASAIIEITNKSSELLTLDTTKVYIVDGTCQQVRDTRVENLSSRRRLSWRVDPHLVRRSGDSSLWVDEPLGMPGAGLIENMLAPLDDSVGLAMMNHGRR